MGIDSTGSTGRADETPASTGDRDAESAESAERATRTQAGPDDDRGHPRAETLTREQYADAMRADGPPIRPDEADGMADRDAPGLTGHEKDNHPAAMLQGESDRSDHGRSADTATEPAPDASAATTAVTHYHSEFKDRPLDLYTDGTRWAAADTPRAQDTVAEKGDIPDRRPAGEELVESADEGSSRLERLRRDVYEEGDNEIDALEKQANVFHDVFSRPPTSSYEGTASQPHIYATQHPGIDAGSAAAAIFTVGLVIDRAVHWAMGYYDKHAKGS
jgi:hypothetical protein